MLPTELTAVHATGTPIKKCLCRLRSVDLNIQIPVVYTLPTWKFFGHGETEAACQSFRHRQNLTAYMHSLISQLLTIQCTHFPLSKGTLIKFWSSSQQF